MHTPNICEAAVTCRTEARGEIHMCAADARDGRPEADPRAGGMACRRDDQRSAARMTSYEVFPGITLSYLDVHTQTCAMARTKAENAFEIHHCRQGRMERAFREEFCYLGAGDLSIARESDMGSRANFPLSHYSGIGIRIDVDRAPKCLSCLLDDVTVSPQALAEKFCGGSQCFIARSNASIDHIFSEIYEVPDSIKKGYLKVKILELLLFLSCLDARGDQAGERCASRSQAALARDVSAYLTACMDRRITLDQLSARFHVSGTNIKTSFKLVYGISIYAYIRKLKMEAAAVVLANTDRSILEIAGQFGYDNGSKFAKAFRDVMGAPPTSYRAGLRV